MTVQAPIGHDPLNGYRMSRRGLRNAGIGRGSNLYRFLNMMATRDTVYFKDDFLGDVINLDNYALGNGAGASAVAFATVVGRDGWIRGTTGTANDATASQSLIGPAIYYGDANCGMEVRLRPVTNIQEVRIEVGFVDVVPGTTASVVNSLVTPSVNTSVVDAAVWVYDETSSVVVNQLVTKGASITAAKGVFTAPTTLAALTVVTARIQLQGNTARLWIDGQLVATLAAPGTDYIEGGNPVAPWVYIRAKNATSKSVDIDVLELWQDREN